MEPESKPLKTLRALPPLMTLTHQAREQIRILQSGVEVGKQLRIEISSKGCSGMSYRMEWVDAAQSGDELVTSSDVGLLVDQKSTLFLIGTTLDFKVDKLSSGFVFVNPNERGRCGCGESFHI